MSGKGVTLTSEDELLSMTVRELTGRFPETMPVLAARGIDLCCGGGYRVLDALTLHNASLDTVIPELMRLVTIVDDRA